MAPTFRFKALRNKCDGYYLQPTGVLITEAICAADCSTGEQRDAMQRAGFKLLTQIIEGSNIGVVTAPPTLDTCRMVCEEIAKRREAFVERIRAERAEAVEAAKEPEMKREERVFWRERAKALERALERVAAEEAALTPEALHRAFVTDDIERKAAAVPPELRAALDALAQERTLAESGAPMA
jgi:hypothetical protein